MTASWKAKVAKDVVTRAMPTRTPPRGDAGLPPAAGIVAAGSGLVEVAPSGIGLHAAV
jgi:hypothetical protein